MERLKNETSEHRLGKQELAMCNMKVDTSKTSKHQKNDVNSCDEINKKFLNCTHHLAIKTDRTYQMKKNAEMMEFCLNNPDTKTVEQSSYFSKGAEHYNTTSALCAVITKEYIKFNAQVNDNHNIVKETVEFKKRIAGNDENNSGTDNDELDRST